MERLTHINENGLIYVDAALAHSPYGEPLKSSGAAIDRLAAYENTGLEPEEIAGLKNIIFAASLRPKGEWEADKFGIWRCPNCRHSIYDEEHLSSFCPNCGADMRGGEGDG